MATADDAADGGEQSGPGRTPWPALKTLKHDQSELLSASSSFDYAQYGLRDGFPHRQAVINWYQRATVRTLGYIADELATEWLIHDRTLLQALITRPKRRRWVSDNQQALSSDAAREYRLKLESEVVHPACNKGYRELRGGATEYIVGDDDGPNPSDLTPEAQENVAMRPGFQALDREQRAVLDSLWDGFRDREALLDWVAGLDTATNGEHDPDVFAEMLDDAVALDCLLGTDEFDDSVIADYRQRLAIKHLLPAFAAAVKSVDAGELAQTKPDSNPWNEVTQ